MYSPSSCCFTYTYLNPIYIFLFPGIKSPWSCEEEFWPPGQTKETRSVELPERFQHLWKKCVNRNLGTNPLRSHSFWNTLSVGKFFTENNIYAVCWHLFLHWTSEQLSLHYGAMYTLKPLASLASSATARQSHTPVNIISYSKLIDKFHLDFITKMKRPLRRTVILM
jgi:hypothetical protein